MVRLPALYSAINSRSVSESAGSGFGEPRRPFGLAGWKEALRFSTLRPATCGEGRSPNAEVDQRSESARHGCG